MNPIELARPTGPSTETLPRAHRSRSSLWLHPSRLFLGLLLLAGAAGHSLAATRATATITNVPAAGGQFTYTITLKNTGSTDIETFWFAWIPGYDFMATSPNNIGSPSNWSSSITGGSPGDGFAIQWVTASAPVHAGSSQTFTFNSADTPAAMAGNSMVLPGTPVGTSTVYSGAPFVGTSDQFVVGASDGPVAPSAPIVKITGPAMVTTSNSKMTVKGKATGSVTSVTYRIGSKSSKSAVGTSAWRFVATLKKGKNVITVLAHGPNGTSKAAKVTITRK